MGLLGLEKSVSDDLSVRLEPIRVSSPGGELMIFGYGPILTCGDGCGSQSVLTSESGVKLSI